MTTMHNVGAALNSEAIRARSSLVQRLMRDKPTLFASVFLSGLLVAAILAPIIAPFDPFEIDLANILQSPNGKHWFGTDGAGRDILSRVLYGSQLTLLMGVTGVSVGGVLGSAMGILAAFYQRIDPYVMRLVDMMLAFPSILIGLAAAAIFGPGLSAIVLALIFATVPDVARIARGAAANIMQQDFIEAGRAIGLRDGTLIGRYLALNCISTILVFLTLRFGQVILISSSLSFLGLGAQPPTAELGMMAAEGRSFMIIAPHIVVIPCLVIFAIVLGVNVLGDALRDALDPKLRA